MTAQKEAPAPTSYENLVNLMAVHSDASNRLALMEASLQEDFLALVDARRDEFAKLQELVGNSAESIEEISAMNRDWFEKAKTLKTPYGSVAFRSSTKLEVKNEELTIVLIEQRGPAAEEQFIRVTKELNLEALENLDDDELKALRIKRVTAESCTVKAAKLDLGKAVAAAKKSADAKPAAAAKA